MQSVAALWFAKATPKVVVDGAQVCAATHAEQNEVKTRGIVAASSKCEQHHKCARKRESGNLREVKVARTSVHAVVPPVVVE